MNIVLLGLFGSGKSTLAQELSKKLDMQIVSSSMTKEYIASKKDGYEAIQRYKSAGKELPEIYAEKIFLDRYSDVKDGLIIDNVYTIQRLQTVLKHLNIDNYIYLDVDVETAINRVRKRGREDFNEDFIKGRLHLFNKNIDLIKKLLGDKLKTYDANVPVKELHEQIFTDMNIKGNNKLRKTVKPNATKFSVSKS